MKLNESQKNLEDKTVLGVFLKNYCVYPWIVGNTFNRRSWWVAELSGVSWENNFENKSVLIGEIRM